MSKDCEIAKLNDGGMKPYFIIEKYATSDGVRTRICDGWYEYLADAVLACNWKNRE